MDFVTPTGRTRYSTRIIEERSWFKRYQHVVIVLQIEEFYSYTTRGEIDRHGMSDPDRVDQGYQWRDATLEDLAMMGERKHEPAVETYRRHSRPNVPGSGQSLGPRPSVPPAGPPDDWPNIVRRHSGPPADWGVPAPRGSAVGPASSTGARSQQASTDGATD